MPKSEHQLQNLGYRTTCEPRSREDNSRFCLDSLSSRGVSCAIVHWASAPAGLYLDYRHYWQSLEVAASTRRFELIDLGISLEVFTFAVMF
jgi:hypothetical protein